MSRREEFAAIYLRRIGDRAVACGDAMLSQQEKNTRQMSRRGEYVAMYLKELVIWP
jgi:hypothetical protein